MFVSESNLAALTGTSLAVTQSCSRKELYPSHVEDGIRGFNLEDLKDILEAFEMVNNHWEEEAHVLPLRQ